MASTPGGFKFDNFGAKTQGTGGGGFGLGAKTAAGPSPAPSTTGGNAFTGFGGAKTTGAPAAGTTGAGGGGFGFSKPAGGATGTTGATTSTSTGGGGFSFNKPAGGAATGGSTSSGGGFNFSNIKPSGTATSSSTGTSGFGGFGTGSGAGASSTTTTTSTTSGFGGKSFGTSTTGGFGSSFSGKSGFSTAVARAEENLPVTMDRKFELLPQDLQQYILNIDLMKRKTREDLDFLMRSNAQTLEILSSAIESSRLVALEVENKQEEIGFRAKALRHESKANARDAQRFGLWSLQQAKANSAIGAVPSEFYWTALNKMEDKLQAYAKEISEIELQLQSTASLNGTHGSTHDSLRAKYNLYGQRSSIGAEEIGQLIKRQSDAFLRISAHVASVHADLDDVRLRYKQRFREDPFAAEDRAEAEQQRRLKNKMQKPVIPQLVNPMQQPQQQQQGGFNMGGKTGGFGTSTTGGFGSSTSGFNMGGKTSGFGTSTTGGFGSSTGGFGSSTGGFGSGSTGGFAMPSLTKNSPQTSSNPSSHSSAGILMGSGGTSSPKTGGFGSTTGGFGGGFGGGGFGSSTGFKSKPKGKR